MERVKKTIEVYEKNAKEYVEFSYPRILQFHLTQFTSYLKKGDYVLDAGCGSGRDSEYFIEEGFKVTAIDMSKKILEEASKVVEADVEFIQMNMAELKFDASTFDGLWCCNSLMHMPKEFIPKTLAGFNKVLKDEGVLYVTVPIGEGEKMIEYPKSGNEAKFFAFYSQTEIEEFLKEAGFKTVKIFAEEDEEGDNWINVFCKKSAI